MSVARFLMIIAKFSDKNVWLSLKWHIFAICVDGA